jgi:hypothetical protein
MIENHQQLRSFATVGLSALDDRLLCAIIMLLKRRLRDAWQLGIAAPVDLLIVGQQAGVFDSTLLKKHRHRIDILRSRDAQTPGLYFPLHSAEIQQQLDLASLVLDGLERAPHDALVQGDQTAIHRTTNEPLRPRVIPSEENFPVSALVVNSVVRASPYLVEAPTDRSFNRNLSSAGSATLNAIIFRWANGTDTDLSRLKMLRWPERSLLQQNSAYLKIATVLTFMPMSLPELAAKSGAQRDVCTQFAYAILDAGHGRMIIDPMVGGASDKKTSAAQTAGAIDTNLQSNAHQRQGVFARIRSRLGL